MEEVDSLWKLIAGLATVIIGLIAAMWKVISTKVDSKVDRELFDNFTREMGEKVTKDEFRQTIDENQRQFSLINVELTDNKQAMIKLADRINTMEENNTRRHIDLLTAIHNNGGSHTKVKR